MAIAAGRPVALAEIFETLSTSTWLKTRLEQRQGFYALGEVEVWVKDRQLRFLDAMRKFAKIERAVQLLGRLPWLEGVAVCNSLAWYQTTETSDIDLFILAKPGRVWSARLLSTLPFLLLRQRPGEGRPDPVCLSFFCASSSLNLETLKIKEFDPYLAYWSLSLVPLVERRDVFKQFALANTWLAELLPNAYGVSRAERFRPVTPGAVRWLPLSERLAKQMQLERLTPAIRELMNRDTRVIVSDEMLKFHESDSRLEIGTALEARMARL